MAQIMPLAAAFVGYIVFWNLSLQLNSVGFYQLSKILIAPAIIIIEAIWFKKYPGRLELAAVALLCIGVTLATVSDAEVRLCSTLDAKLVAFPCAFAKSPRETSMIAHHIQIHARACILHGTKRISVLVGQVTANLPGLLMSGLAIWTTSIYQIWAGTKQKEFQVKPCPDTTPSEAAPIDHGLLRGYTIPAFQMGISLCCSSMCAIRGCV